MELNPSQTHWAVCGSTEFCDAHPRVSLDQSLHGVRCCSDRESEGWSRLEASACLVFGRSNLDGICYTNSTHLDARLACESTGGRLCTKLELEQNCATMTGCDLNRHLIWSSTPVEPSTTHFAICGSTKYCQWPPVVSHDQSLYGVRCCSDNAIDATVDGWRLEPGCLVHGQSEFSGTCYVDSTYEEASFRCRSHGGRLCTKLELEQDCAAETGCGLNERLIWSSTEITWAFPSMPTPAPTAAAPTAAPSRDHTAGPADISLPPVPAAPQVTPEPSVALPPFDPMKKPMDFSKKFTMGHDAVSDVSGELEVVPPSSSPTSASSRASRAFLVAVLAVAEMARALRR